MKIKPNFTSRLSMFERCSHVSRALSPGMSGKLPHKNEAALLPTQKRRLLTQAIKPKPASNMQKQKLCWICEWSYQNWLKIKCYRKPRNPSVIDGILIGNKVLIFRARSMCQKIFPFIFWWISLWSPLLIEYRHSLILNLIYTEYNKVYNKKY